MDFGEISGLINIIRFCYDIIKFCINFCVSHLKKTFFRVRIGANRFPLVIHR
jgi:hypothetical protein